MVQVVADAVGHTEFMKDTTLSDFSTILLTDNPP